MDREFLNDIYLLLQSIQAYPKGSIGSMGNIYLPQLSVKRVDIMAEKVRRLLTDRPHSPVIGSEFNQPVCEHGYTQKCPECEVDKAWG